MELDMDQLDKKPLGEIQQNTQQGYRVKFDPNVASPDQDQDLSVYPKECRQEIQRVKDGEHWIVASNLKAAILLRCEQKLALSIRESDIVLRGAIDVTNPLMKAMLLDVKIGAVITEPHSSVAGDDSPYSLRESFNRGLQFFQKNNIPFNVYYERKEGYRNGAFRKAILRFDEIISKLVNLGLRPWDSEYETGFHTDLLKPEYFNWQQWNRKKASFGRLFTPENFTR